MRDEDVVGPLQQLLAGLSQINFNITVDTASLEYEAVPEALQPPLQLRLPRHLLDDKDVHQKKRRRRHHKASSRSHDRHVTPIDNKSHDRHVTPIEDSDGDGESSVSASSDEEEEEEGRGGERNLEVFLTESEKRGDVNGGGNETQVALVLSEEGEEEKQGKVEDVFRERGKWEADSLGTYQTEVQTSELEGVADDLWGRQREAGGSGEIEEDGDGGGEVVGAGDGEVGEDGMSLSNQIEDSHQDKNQERFLDEVQDNRDQDNVTNSAQDIQQDTLLDDNYCRVGASGMEGENEEEEREEKDREESTCSEMEATTVPLEMREPQILESRQIPSPDSRPVAAIPNQFGTGSPLQLLPTPFNLDSVPDQTSKNPFDQLEQGLVGDHTYLRVRNPFDNSPPDKDLATPTADSAQNGFLPTPSSQPHPTTINPFDSTRDTPSPSLSSLSSSDYFRGKSPSLAGRQEGGGGERRVSRADSLEWSIYMEQNMVDMPGGVATSELALEEDYYSAELGMAELLETIQRLKKDLITSSSSIPPLSPVEQHALRRKIVRLQLQLHNKKEEEEESGAAYEEVSGHKFVRQPRQRRVLRDVSCLACKKRVRGLIREWHRCKTCRSVCHKKCLSSVVNQCSVPGDDVEYILEMCPEVGLTDQQFRLCQM
ncbi:Differentially expressed in FDCP 8 homolog A [Geodia barretti]|nr:Differentially expressed in FDCP 8 homolog A [Geodia barretti]